MDNLVYNYNKDANGKLINNKLNYINDWATASSGYTGDLRTQSNGNYQYDAIGNMIADVQAGVSNINWSVYGKILSQTSSANGTITYTYDPAGQRATKTANGITTYYVRDAQGNTLAVYDNKLNQTNWREQHLYGSSRLGMWTPNVNLANNNAATVWDTVGHKQYELNNHLGNVMATITDKRIAHSSDGTTIDYYQPDITTAQQYYAFGSLMPGLTFTQSNNYRYGFNGKENDNEVKGVGNEQDYGMRIYDPRVGRFLSVDPLSENFPDLTSYQFASNSPIDGIDLDGGEHEYYTVAWSEKTGKPVITNYSLGPKESTFLGFKIKVDHVAYVNYQSGSFGNKTFRLYGADIDIFKNWLKEPSTKDLGVILESDDAHTLSDINASLIIGADMLGALPARGTARPVNITEDLPNTKELQASGQQQQLIINKKNGADYEQEVKKITEQTQTGVVEQVTIKTKSSKTKIDLVGKDQITGEIKLTEVKASQTAPLTRNQKIAHPELLKHGGKVVGKGKPGFPRGTVIPPTKVNVIRKS